MTDIPSADPRGTAHQAGGRFAHAALSGADEARIRELWGRPPLNLYRILGHQPAVLRAWTEWNNTLRHGCELPRALRELIFLRSAHLQASDYEWAQHVVMARKAGLAEGKIEAARGATSNHALDEREQAVVRATGEITDGRLSDEAFGALRTLLSPGEMIEVIVTASHACMLARVIQAIGVTMDGEVAAPRQPVED